MRRWIAVMGVALASLAGCDTRPPCDVICGNEARCGVRDEAACRATCSARLAMASSDCRVAADAYHRCWSAQGTCPAAPTTAAPGCTDEHARMSLACPGGAPLISDPPDGI